MASVTQVYGTPVAMTVTNLQSINNYSSTDYAWLSARVDLTSVNCDDVMINIHLTTANTAPANDKAASVFIVVWYKDNAGNWRPSDLGTTTQPIATEGKTVQIGATGVGSYPAGLLPYNAAQCPLDTSFTLQSIGLTAMPHGFSVCIKNYTGAALSTGCIVDYTPITFSIA